MRYVSRKRLNRRTFLRGAGASVALPMLDAMLREHLDTGGACIMTTHGSLRPQGFELQELELVSGAGQP